MVSVDCYRSLFVWAFFISTVIIIVVVKITMMMMIIIIMSITLVLSGALEAELRASEMRQRVMSEARPRGLRAFLGISNRFS